MTSRTTALVCLLLASMPGWAWSQTSTPGFTIQLDTIHRGYDGKTCWVHPRAGLIPGERPAVVLTMMRLEVKGSDLFLPIADMRTDDLGKHWTPPREHVDTLGRRDEPDGVQWGVCDFTPAWHAATGKLLAIGQTVRYRNDKLVENRRRETAYSVYDAQARTWSSWATVAMPDEPRFTSCGAGSVQRVDREDGTILLPVYHRRREDTDYSSAVLRCRFDGRVLTYEGISNSLRVEGGRGLAEPSLVRYRDRYYLTLRNNEAGYVSTSDDGRTFAAPRRWQFDDGTDLGNYNTQQHWVAHSDGLFLVYTRKGANNDHVFRHRAPLFMAQVDPETLRVVRKTERVLVPERGARLGNFGVVDVSPRETWVTVAEWMQTWGPKVIIPKDNPRGADNSVYVARIVWDRPNARFAAAVDGKSQSESALPDKPAAKPEKLLPGFERSELFGEQNHWSRLPSGVRVLVNAPLQLGDKPRLLVVYATPNGNTVEQTLGCAKAEGLDYRFDIQHVAAQVRRLRAVDTSRDIVLAVVQPPQVAWPAYRREQADSGVIMRELVASLRKNVGADRVALTCHSGGGSFLLGYISAGETIPADIERFVFLDANYSYSDDERHGDKLLEWLRGDRSRQLVVIAYDDREIISGGKKVVGPTGGTYRASQRMLARLRRDVELADATVGPFQHSRAMDGQIEFFIHPNADNKILHTALVGEMNGLLEGMTLGTEAKPWGTFGGPRAYTDCVQPRPFADPLAPRASIARNAPERRWALPERAADAPMGKQFRDSIAPLPRDGREAAIEREIAAGNVPDFLRRLTPVRLEAADARGDKHEAIYYATSDYLAVGTNGDFFRVPMSPRTALAIAEATGMSLITQKISDQVFAAATARLQPKPLTEDRESVASFYRHHELIEEQLRGRPREGLVVGIKKDVVLSNRLKEKPHRVAIYGWHYPDGRPIQSLYIGHADRYVDYSQGIRLVADRMMIDGHERKLSDVLIDPVLSALLSDEGLLDTAALRKAADWGRGREGK